MPLLLLSLAFLIYCYCTGIAWILLFRPHAPLLRSWLISPAVGLAIVVLAVMGFNQAGLPIQSFARPLALISLLCAMGILRWRRTQIPIRFLTPILGCQLVVLALVGWPALHAGIDWIGYGNVDMLGYVFAAQRQMELGFYEAPSLHDLLGFDYTQYYWFYHVPGFVRFGSENTVAFLSSVAGIAPRSGFPAAIMALGMMHVSVLSALILLAGRKRSTAYVASLVLTLSPLFLQSIQLQVIAQVGGIALMLALCCLAAESLPNRALSLREGFLRAITMAPVFSALMVFYPELLPFCAIVLCLTHVLSGRGWLHFSRVTLIALTVLAISLVLLRQNALTGIMTLLFHGGQGTADNTIHLEANPFGIAILPSALPAVLGFINLYSPPAEPLLSVCIAAAITLFALLLILCFWRRHLAQPTCSMFAAMLTLGVSLFCAPNPFGVFKLSMFIQPALAACIAVALMYCHRYIRWGVLVPLLSLHVVIGQIYVRTFSGIATYNSFLPFHSADPIDLKELPSSAKFEADTPSMAYDHLLALHLRGHLLRFQNRDGITGAVNWAINNDPRIRWPKLGSILPESIGYAAPLSDMLAQYGYHSLSIFGAQMTEFGPKSYDDSIFVSVRPPFNPFNNLHEPEVGLVNHPVFLLRESHKVHNHLIFLNTTASNDYYSFLGSLGRVYSYYQNEPDPMHGFVNRFYAVGRHFIFEVKNPDEQIRLRLSITRSILGSDRQGLPDHITITGAETTHIPLIGAGAANIYTPPLTPLQIDDRYFIAIDLGSEPSQIQHPKSTLMKIFYPTVELDCRYVTGFARDISALSNSEYLAQALPNKLEVFPQDLLDQPTLEFSGIYEDSWLSPHARVRLGSVGHQKTFSFSAEVPDLPFVSDTKKPELILRANGTEIARYPLHPGPISLVTPFNSTTESNIFEIEATVGFKLPAPDGRPVSVRLLQIRMD